MLRVVAAARGAERDGEIGEIVGECGGRHFNSRNNIQKSTPQLLFIPLYLST